MKWSGAIFIVLLLVAGVFFSRCGGDSGSIDTVATPIPVAVNNIHLADEYFGAKVQLKTKVFYRANGYHRTWLKKRRPDKMFHAFVDEVKESARYGLVPADYKIESIEEAVASLYDNRKRTTADLSALDIRISASFFLFTTHLIEGRIRYPGARKFIWQKGMPLENDIALLIEMESASDLRKELEALQPKDPQYKRLQEALKKYRELEEADTLPPVSVKGKVHPGEVDDAIPLVRQKLRLTDLRGKDDDTLRLYDERLVEAVQKFQERHGLNPDGILDEPTIRSLNVSIRQKCDLIALNLERLRWMPHLKGEGDEIIINVPEYMLRAYQDNREKMKMRVVLGAEYTPTAIFHDTLKYVVFSPTWMVPRSIFEKEFLPKLRDDPGHFSAERFKFFKNGVETDPYQEPWSDEDLDLTAYHVVENPGEANALGKVKFIMPNDFSIYLHDTPADKLFAREARALSHGCIRLERPEEFALYLLSDEKEWTKKKIEEVMASPEPTQVDLKKPWPVYIVYRTVWVDDDGQIHFRNDIYGHDERHLASMQE